MSVRRLLLVAAAVVAVSAHGDEDHSTDAVKAEVDHSGHHDASMTTSSTSHDGHPTAFTTDYRGVEVLFRGWTNMSQWQYVLTLIALMLFGIFSESLVIIERKLQQRIFPASEKGATAVINDISMNDRILRTALYAVRTTVHFLLMLASMTFDVGVFLSIMGGFAFGFFIFSSSHVLASSSAGHSHA